MKNFKIIVPTYLGCGSGEGTYVLSVKANNKKEIIEKLWDGDFISEIKNGKFDISSTNFDTEDLDIKNIKIEEIDDSEDDFKEVGVVDFKKYVGYSISSDVLDILEKVWNQDVINEIDNLRKINPDKTDFEILSGSFENLISSTKRQIFNLLPDSLDDDYEIITDTIKLKKK